MELTNELNIAPHLFVNALELSRPWTARARFANSISSLLVGELPLGRYFAAGKACKRDGTPPSAIEESMADWFETDLNPFWTILSSVPDLAEVAAMFDSLNVSSEQAFEMNLSHWKRAVSKNGDGFETTRVSLDRFEDPEACLLVSLANTDAIARAVLIGQRRRAPPSFAAVADKLGVGASAAGEVARVLESEGRMPVSSVARILGCNQRTLQRQLKAEGLTAEAIRQACMLVWASNRLRDDASLTEIAMDAGYFDLAHMNRAFRTACGIPPSALRRSAIGSVKVAAAA